MKRNLISLMIAIIGLIGVLTIGSSANFYGVVTGETLPETEEESSSDKLPIATIRGGLISGNAVDGNQTIAGEFQHTDPYSTPTRKTASQNVKVAVRKPTSQDAEQISANAESASGFFTDVPQDSYYFDAVRWAVGNGITNGTTATTFSPGNACTRAQVVTFFWRNAGQPEPSSQTNPFSDVQESAYYYKAVLWAVEQGITNGTSATTFSPNQPCTYAHVVTFLWRLKAEDKETAEGAAWYVTPAAWANSGGLLTGTRFIPNEPCPRSDIVTYLYRSRPDRIDVSMSAPTYDNYVYSAVINAYDFDGNPVWTHTTGEYVEPHIFEIGVFGDQYLYVESEIVIALDLHTGALRWKNGDFQGYPISATGYALGTNGVLYLFGVEGPSFFGIDMNGNTVGIIEDFYNIPDWLLPTDNIRRVDENHMSASVYSPDEGKDKIAFLVDLRDFSYSGPFDENDPAVTPKMAPFLSGKWMSEGENVSYLEVTQIGNLYLFDVAWKLGHRWSFCGKWENGAIRYTNGLYSHRYSDFSWEESGIVQIVGDTLVWTDGAASAAQGVVYRR